MTPPKPTLTKLEQVLASRPPAPAKPKRNNYRGLKNDMIDTFRAELAHRGFNDPQEITFTISKAEDGPQKIFAASFPGYSNRSADIDSAIYQNIFDQLRSQRAKTSAGKASKVTGKEQEFVTITLEDMANAINQIVTEPDLKINVSKYVSK